MFRRGAEVPGGHHGFTRISPVQATPRHGGAPQGSTSVMSRLFAVLYACAGPSFSPFSERQREHRLRDGQHADCDQRRNCHAVSVGQLQEESKVVLIQ